MEDTEVNFIFTFTYLFHIHLDGQQIRITLIDKNGRNIFAHDLLLIILLLNINNCCDFGR